LRALTFWAGPKGKRVLRGLPLESVATVLAKTSGHMGSCAEYLYLTVKHLEEKDIRDRNLWLLQALVAEEIRRIHGPGVSQGTVQMSFVRSVRPAIGDLCARERNTPTPATIAIPRRTATHEQ